jgi:hypothetical protein
MLKNPQSCEICGAHWDFQTDWLGYVHAQHPVTPCAPPVYAYEIEPEDEPDPASLPERVCKECNTRFIPGPHRNAARLCSPECRIARRERKKAESEKRRGKWWRLRVIASLDLPVRKCVECHKRFTITSKWSVKQVLCSAKCVKVREARKSRERAA